MPLLISGVEHHLYIIESQQTPVELVAVAFRSLNDFKTKNVAVEAHRARHVEDLKQSANTSNLDAHWYFSLKA